MGTIKREEMGDVWPAVEPGLVASDYGTATLTPSDPCPVRSLQTFTLTYTVGKFGLDDTGAIRVAFRWVTDCGGLQATDPAAINYVTATASNGVPLVVLVEPHGYRPWSLAVRITVKGGFMRPGDQITVVFGDRSGGSPGFRMQTIAERAFEFKVSVDACATGFFNPLPEPLSVPIVAGPVRSFHIAAPGLRRPGEPFSIGIRAEDAWGNPAMPGDVTVSLDASGTIDGLPEQVAFESGECTLRITGVSIPVESVTTVTAKNRDGLVLARSNPVVVQAGSLAGYWGDLHGQSGETVGVGSIDEYMAFAKDIAFLDVSGHQANDFQITNAFWERINSVTTDLDQEGQFVVYPGYEWSGNTPVGGDHNVFFRHADRAIRRSSHAELIDRSDIGTDCTTLDALFAAMQDEDCVIWAHVGGRPADVAYAHDPALKTAVEVHSNWGTFEWILTDSLALGHRVGVVANSDGHKGRPGAGAPGATEFGAYGGLTCFLAPELTRDALFECMRRRHHYGTTGARIGLRVEAAFDTPADLFPRDPAVRDDAPLRTDKAMMGDIVRTEDSSLRLRIRVEAPSAIERVDILRGSEQIETLRCFGPADLGHRVRVYWQGAEYRGRGRNTRWHGVIAAENGKIVSADPINHWNWERECALRSDGRVHVDAVTSGNYAGVDLRLDQEDCTLEIDTNLVSGRVDLSGMGVLDHVLDAGGLERRIVIRRLPEALDVAHLDETIHVGLSPAPRKHDLALWVRVTTTDGHQAWSSPIYIIP